jgi:hypothetical protein
MRAGSDGRGLIEELHALGHREGMGEPALPPQGVGTPVLFLVSVSQPLSHHGNKDRPPCARGQPGGSPTWSIFLMRLLLS